MASAQSLDIPVVEKRIYAANEGACDGILSKEFPCDSERVEDRGRASVQHARTRMEFQAMTRRQHGNEVLACDAFESGVFSKWLGRTHEQRHRPG
ncbi:hypothetical protein D7X74_04575 [Corallococcus sp. CA047B]|nr:hypothetical protein D7X74_04575 [Corallococcus sp. CA047B]